MSNEKKNTAIEPAEHSQAIPLKEADFDLRKPTTVRQAFTIASLLARSGIFKDAMREGEAYAKIAIGLDLGLTPTQSLRSVHIVEGKPELGYDVIGALLKKNGYRWKVEALTNERCLLKFHYSDGELLGDSEFTIADAKAAGLVKDRGAWDKTPRNMLFARALSNGARWYAPEVFGGAVYGLGEIAGKSINSDPNSVLADYRDLLDEETAPKEDETDRTDHSQGLDDEKSTESVNWLMDQVGRKVYDQMLDVCIKIERDIREFMLGNPTLEGKDPDMVELRFRKWVASVKHGPTKQTTEA